MNSRHGALALIVLAGAVLSAGCGPGGPEGKVAGTVKLDGSPLEGATVEFQPEQGSASYGQTDAMGHYELYFSSDAKGAEPGNHVVRITLPSPSADDANAGKVPRILPKYNTKSELTATVAKGTNTCDFDLKSR